MAIGGTHVDVTLPRMSPCLIRRGRVNCGTAQYVLVRLLRRAERLTDRWRVGHSRWDIHTLRILNSILIRSCISGAIDD